MVKKFVIIIIALFVILGAYFMICGTFLKSVPNYRLYSSEGKEVPVSVYYRKGNEVLLLFDEKLDLGIYTILVIAPNHKMIGLPEGGSNSFIQLSDSYLYQKQKGNQITAIYPSNTYFDDSKIFDVEFVSDNEIKFRTSLEGLKSYGDTFLLKLRN